MVTSGGLSPIPSGLIQASGRIQEPASPPNLEWHPVARRLLRKPGAAQHSMAWRGKVGRRLEAGGEVDLRQASPHKDGGQLVPRPDALLIQVCLCGKLVTSMVREDTSRASRCVCPGLSASHSIAWRAASPPRLPVLLCGDARVLVALLQGCLLLPPSPVQGLSMCPKEGWQQA